MNGGNPRQSRRHGFETPSLTHASCRILHARHRGSCVAADTKIRDRRGMNRLSFRRMRGKFDIDEPYDLDIAVPVIDGRPLHEIVGDRFYGIATTLAAPPSRHLLGQPTYGEDGLTALLDGSCLVVGCCGVMAQVDVREDTVY